MANQGRLSNPEFAKAVAEMYINGASRAEMADEFGVHRDTISIWTGDPRVQAHASRFAQERMLRITRKIDTEIESRLRDVDEMEPELLLKIRKEFLERGAKQAVSSLGQDTNVINDAISAMEENPDLAEALKKLTSGGA